MQELLQGKHQAIACLLLSTETASHWPLLLACRHNRLLTELPSLQRGVEELQAKRQARRACQNLLTPASTRSRWLDQVQRVRAGAMC